MLHGACHPFLDAHCRMLGLSQYRVQLVRSCVLGSSNLASSNWGCGTPHLQSGQQHSCWHHQLWWLHLDITVCTCCMRKYSQFRGLLTGETWQMFQSFQASWNTTRHGSFTNYYIYLNFYWGVVRSVHRTRRFLISGTEPRSCSFTLACYGTYVWLTLPIFLFPIVQHVEIS